MRRAQIASAAATEVAVDAGVACGPATASADDGAGAATVDGDSVVEPEAVAVSGDTDALGATGAFAGAACVEVSGVAFGVTGAAGAAGAAGVPGWGVPGLGVSPLVVRYAAKSEIFAARRWVAAMSAMDDAATCAPLDTPDAAFAAFMLVAAGAVGMCAG